MYVRKFESLKERGSPARKSSRKGTTRNVSALALLTVWWFGAAMPLSAVELVAAFAFGSRELDCETSSQPGTSYTTVVQVAVDPVSLEYTEQKGYGFVRLFASYVDVPFTPFGDRGGWEVYGNTVRHSVCGVISSRSIPA